jgi:hypothetical protein
MADVMCTFRLILITADGAGDYVVLSISTALVLLVEMLGYCKYDYLIGMCI